MEKKLKQVIIVRKDLNMSPGKAAAQCCHASIGALMGAFRTAKSDADKWLYEEGQTKIILMVEDEEALLALHELVKADKLLKGRNYLVRDAGHTELKGENLTTLGIGPCTEESINKYTGELKLYR